MAPSGPETDTAAADEAPLDLVDPVVQGFSVPQPAFPRYAFGDRIGVGGMGEVWAASDARLGREVALKLVREEKREDARVARAILHEAAILAEVAHPGVVPVHDVGQTADGRWFYAMKRVAGRSLSEVLSAIARGDESVLDEFPLFQLVLVFRQVALTIAHTHARAVIHRDVKPQNVMIGPFGEVQLVDWGLARRRNRAEPVPEQVDAPPVPAIEVHSLDHGMVQGTPAYMAPEQVQGKFEAVDERSDVYGLGAVLYEVLTLKSPYAIGPGETMVQFLRRVVKTEPELPSQVAPPGREVPPELEDLALRCLSRRREDRPASAAEVADEVSRWVEGLRGRESSRLAAEVCLGQARAAMIRYRVLHPRVDAERESMERRDAATLPWANPEDKRPGWLLKEWGEALAREAQGALAAALQGFHEVLGHDPHHREARGALAELYYERLVELDGSGPEADADRKRYEALVRAHDDGRFGRRLRGDGRFSVSTGATVAEASVAAFRTVEGRRVPTETRPLGRTPVERVKVERGDHLLVLRLAGPRDIRVPFRVGRGEDLVLDVPIPAIEAIPPGFVYIAGGPAQLGGDGRAPGALSARTVQVPPFAVGRLPVTFGEYLEFVSELHRAAPERARRRLPRSPSLARARWQFGADGSVVLDLQPGDPSAHKGVPPGPVFGVSWEDAVAYCAWRGRRDGRDYRLPADAEWEKAARGPFSWTYPWGDRFDPVCCRMALSRRAGARPGPAGAFPADTSVYGVQEMAGGVREWCADDFHEAAELRLVRGGGWQSQEPDCRCATRAGLRPDARADDVGFRLVVALAAG